MSLSATPNSLPLPLPAPAEPISCISRQSALHQRHQVLVARPATRLSRLPRGRFPDNPAPLTLHRHYPRWHRRAHAGRAHRDHLLGTRTRCDSAHRYRSAAFARIAVSAWRANSGGRSRRRRRRRRTGSGICAGTRHQQIGSNHYCRARPGLYPTRSCTVRIPTGDPSHRWRR